MKRKGLLQRVRSVAARVARPVEKLAAKALEHRKTGGQAMPAVNRQVVENAFSRWRALASTPELSGTGRSSAAPPRAASSEPRPVAPERQGRKVAMAETSPRRRSASPRKPAAKKVKRGQKHR